VTTLKQKGLDYPPGLDDARTAAGNISNGNGLIIHKLIEEKSDEFTSDLLLSSELLFSYFLEDEFCEAFNRYRLSKFRKSYVLLFIRDPISHAASYYQQSIKNGDYSGTVSDFFSKYNMVSQVNQVLNNLSAMTGLEINVRNYSANKNILPIVESWLGLECGDLDLPPVERVNRSLTRSETEFQRLLNSNLDSAYNSIAVMFSNQLPNLQGDPVFPSRIEQEKLWDRLAPDIEKVNRRLEVGERYEKERDLREPKLFDKHHYPFSSDQLSIIAKGLAGEVEKARRIERPQLRRLRQLERRNQRLKHQIAAIKNSKSCFLTKPLRWLRALWTRLSGGNQ
jgi:hypothetical protein